MPQPLLPMFPSDVTEINELVSFAKREGTVYYFNGPMPVFSHAETDRASFRMFTSQLVIHDNCTQAEIVRAFGISAISMKRYVKQYRQSGAAGFFKGRAARQPRVLTPAVLQKAQELIQQGHGRTAVAQELGLKSDTLRKAIRAGRIVEPIKKSEAVADKSQRSVADSQADMGMGCVRVEERVLAAFGGLVEAPTRFEAGRDVSGGGVLWALPALLANGLLHRQAECFELPKGFYGVVHVLLLMGFLALARVKSLERLRFEAPGEWGHLLGLDRIPEVHTLRSKLGQMAQGPQVESWSAGLSQQWMEQAPELAGRLYLDGHVRVYHGHQTPLPKRYVAREKLCLRGTTDYWINDGEGRPFFVVNTAANPGLIAVLRQEIIPRLVKEVPHQPKAAELQADPYRCRFVMIFDREGYSPELFAELWGQRIAAQTYRKGTLEDWPVEEFQEPEVVLPNGEKQSMKLAERGVWLGKKLWVREIRLLGSDGHQTAVVSTDFQSGLVQIARQMFSRWAQENWFKVRHEVVRVIVQYEDHKMNLQFRLQVALPAPARLATVGSEAAGTTYPLSSRGRRGPRGTLCGCQHQGGRGVRLSDMPNVSELPQASLSLTSQKMLIRLEPKGKQPVASLLSRGTRTFTAAGVKAGAKSFVLLERNVINPTSRLIRRQVAPQGRPRRWRAEERWRKPTPSCNGTDRGWNMAPPRKRADFQQVVHHENAGRTFAGGNRK